MALISSTLAGVSFLAIAPIIIFKIAFEVGAPAILTASVAVGLVRALFAAMEFLINFKISLATLDFGVSPSDAAISRETSGFRTFFTFFPELSDLRIIDMMASAMVSDVTPGIFFRLATETPL